MLDFTSALYLGWTHETREAPQDEPLSLGKPAALEEPPGAGELARQVAQLVGCEAGIVAPSTLQLFWDLPLIWGRDVEFFADSEVYPIARWGLERAAIAGSKVTWFTHHDPESLARSMAGVRRRPVVVTDGFCPACGSSAPMARYIAAVRRSGGLLVVDDTQALGVLGAGQGQGSPYGFGGGGTLRQHGIQGNDVVAVTSLAKAFGSPVACLSSSASIVRDFAERSLTRVHCSPPSTAVIRAGLQALEWNRRIGDLVRARLAARVREFRAILRARGWQTQGGCFPVQTIHHPCAQTLYDRLLSRGIRTVPQPGTNGGNAARVSFILTALHTQSQLMQVARALLNATRESLTEEGIYERTNAE